MTLTNSGVITTTGDGAHGILAQSIGGGGGNGGDSTAAAARARGRRAERQPRARHGRGRRRRRKRRKRLALRRTVPERGRRPESSTTEHLGGPRHDRQRARQPRSAPAARPARRRSPPAARMRRRSRRRASAAAAATARPARPATTRPISAIPAATCSSSASGSVPRAVRAAAAAPWSSPRRGHVADDRRLRLAGHPGPVHRGRRRQRSSGDSFGRQRELSYTANVSAGGNGVGGSAIRNGHDRQRRDDPHLGRGFDRHPGAEHRRRRRSRRQLGRRIDRQRIQPGREPANPPTATNLHGDGRGRRHGRRGGDGNTVGVGNTGAITTGGERAYGIEAQSIGGGGGNAGTATAGTQGTTGGTFSANVGVGGTRRRAAAMAAR